MLIHAKKFGAKCYYAPVGFSAWDHVRFEESIALKGDVFYANYTGLKEINL